MIKVFLLVNGAHAKMAQALEGLHGKLFKHEADWSTDSFVVDEERYDLSRCAGSHSVNS